MKEVKTANELTCLVQEKLMQIPIVKDDAAFPAASKAYWHERDKEGRNWDINMQREPIGYLDAFKKIKDTIRSKYDIASQ